MNNKYVNKYAIPYAAKNEIPSKIIKGFLTESEVEEIKQLIEDAKKYDGPDEFWQPQIIDKLGRMHIELNYPEHLKNKFEKLASELCGEEVRMNHNSYLDYSGKFYGEDGISDLPYHFDSDNYFTKITFDYQLDKTFDWPIFVENEEFVLDYMDLLIFWGAGRLHWRKKKKFSENERVEMVTMHFSKQEDFERLNAESRLPEPRKERIDHLVEMTKLYFSEKENKPKG
jgi:hypothetical protein